MKIPKELPAKPVAIWWDDAYHVSRQGFTPESFERVVPAIRVTLGWILHRDSENIIVAWTCDPKQEGEAETNFDSFWRIPRAMVRKIVTLCPSSPKRRSKSSSRSRSPRPSATPSAPPPSSAPPSEPGAADAAPSPSTDYTASDFLP